MVSDSKLEQAYAIARAELLRQRNEHGWWTGELSVSPLATATAVVALHLCDPVANRSFVERGLDFLRRTQNSDGGWGDTLKSFSNISTTMLANAAFHVTRSVASSSPFAPRKENTETFRGAKGEIEADQAILNRADKYIESKGGVPGLIARYGKDKTFSVPILTCCALAGVVKWNQIPRLPFELAWLPPQFYKTVKLPVVSYALPALIAIGQVRHHHGNSKWNPLHWIRNAARKPTLRRLETLQPSNGGFLEATPLTAFVTMSLAGMGLANHPVARKGVEFLKASVRPDGGWPIDTNLSTWVTTLSINALGDDLERVDKDAIREWLLAQQYKTIHPYTNADPGGWAWTDLPGGVPDADDTAGALLALAHLTSPTRGEVNERVLEAAENGIRWLLSLQNRDGGWPTFCRGWGTLPFDRSSPDITAHALRAIARWRKDVIHWKAKPRFLTSIDRACKNGLHYLSCARRNDGNWIPLWFGNQDDVHEENPIYGTSRVLLSLLEKDLSTAIPSEKYRSDEGIWSLSMRGAFALEYLRRGIAEKQLVNGEDVCTEEVALSLEPILSESALHHVNDLHDTMLATTGLGHVQSPIDVSIFPTRRVLDQLADRVLSGAFTEPAPIGFYFAKLWYFEKLYPIIWTVGALRRACEFERRRGAPLL